MNLEQHIYGYGILVTLFACLLFVQPRTPYAPQLAFCSSVIACSECTTQRRCLSRLLDRDGPAVHVQAPIPCLFCPRQLIVVHTG